MTVKGKKQPIKNTSRRYCHCSAISKKDSRYYARAHLVFWYTKANANNTNIIKELRTEGKAI